MTGETGGDPAVAATVQVVRETGLRVQEALDADLSGVTGATVTPIPAQGWTHGGFLVSTGPRELVVVTVPAPEVVIVAAGHEEVTFRRTPTPAHLTRRVLTLVADALADPDPVTGVRRTDPGR